MEGQEGVGCGGRKLEKEWRSKEGARRAMEEGVGGV